MNPWSSTLVFTTENYGAVHFSKWSGTTGRTCRVKDLELRTRHAHSDVRQEAGDWLGTTIRLVPHKKAP